jgi:hypothetical protein
MKAFPHIAKVHMLDGNSIIKEEITGGGMELRDYFAAKALGGLVAKAVSENQTAETAAEAAYLFADAMMEARNG